MPVGRWTAALAGFAVFLCLASLTGQYSRFYLDHPTLLGFVDRFHVARETAVPTWYSVSLLLVTSVVAGVATAVSRSRGDARWVWWGGIAVLLLLFSLDDAAGIHEMFATVLSRLEVGGEGFLMHPWVVLGIPFALLLGAIYVRFLWSLPKRTRWLLLAGGVLFFGGAVGFEMIGARMEWIARGADGAMFPRSVRKNPFSWQVVATVEELFQMLGVVVVLHALLDHLKRAVGGSPDRPVGMIVAGTGNAVRSGWTPAARGPAAKLLRWDDNPLYPCGPFPEDTLPGPGGHGTDPLIFPA